MERTRLSDDVYILMIWDDEEQEVSMMIVDTLEDFKSCMDVFNVISWANITGENMVVGQFNTEKELKLSNVEITEVEKD